MTRVTDTGEAGYDVYVEESHAGALQRALADAGVPAADAETAEAIRIEAGVPRFNRDMDEQTIPLEAGIEPRAISLTKGCYVGQEVIIRVLHRGHGRVARKLVGLAFDDAVRRGAWRRCDGREPWDRTHHEQRDVAGAGTAGRARVPASGFSRARDRGLCCRPPGRGDGAAVRPPCQVRL